MDRNDIDKLNKIFNTKLDKKDIERIKKQIKTDKNVKAIYYIFNELLKEKYDHEEFEALEFVILKLKIMITCCGVFKEDGSKYFNTYPLDAGIKDSNKLAIKELEKILIK